MQAFKTSTLVAAFLPQDQFLLCRGGPQLRLCLIQNLWIRLTQQLTAVVDIDAILIDLQSQLTI